MITCHVFGIKEDAFSISVLDRNNKITVKIVHSSGDEIELELAWQHEKCVPQTGANLGGQKEPESHENDGRDKETSTDSK